MRSGSVFVTDRVLAIICCMISACVGVSMIIDSAVTRQKWNHVSPVVGVTYANNFNFVIGLGVTATVLALFGLVSIVMNFFSLLVFYEFLSFLFFLVNIYGVSQIQFMPTYIKELDRTIRTLNPYELSQLERNFRCCGVEKYTDYFMIWFIFANATDPEYFHRDQITKFYTVKEGTPHNFLTSLQSFLPRRTTTDPSWFWGRANPDALALRGKKHMNRSISRLRKKMLQNFYPFGEKWLTKELAVNTSEFNFGKLRQGNEVLTKNGVGQQFFEPQPTTNRGSFQTKKKPFQKPNFSSDWKNNSSWNVIRQPKDEISPGYSYQSKSLKSGIEHIKTFKSLLGRPRPWPKTKKPKIEIIKNFRSLFGKGQIGPIPRLPKRPKIEKIKNFRRIFHNFLRKHITITTPSPNNRSRTGVLRIITDLLSQAVIHQKYTKPAKPVPLIRMEDYPFDDIEKKEYPVNVYYPIQYYPAAHPIVRYRYRPDSIYSFYRKYFSGWFSKAKSSLSNSFKSPPGYKLEEGLLTIIYKKVTNLYRSIVPVFIQELFIAFFASALYWSQIFWKSPYNLIKWYFGSGWDDLYWKYVQPKKDPLLPYSCCKLPQVICEGDITTTWVDGCLFKVKAQWPKDMNHCIMLIGIYLIATFANVGVTLLFLLGFHDKCYPM